MIHKNKYFIIIFSLVFILLTLLLIERASFKGQQAIRIDIDAQTTAGQVITLLKQNNLITNVFRVKLAMKLLRVEQKIQAGSYYIKPTMTTYQILLAIQGKGKVNTKVFKKITIPEGLTIKEIITLLEGMQIPDIGRFTDIVTNGKAILLSKYDFLRDYDIESIEGYLFPDTYMLSDTTRADVLLTLMLDRFQSVVVPMYKKANKTKYTLHQVLTMASIIEKESSTRYERPLVASVFYNRLRYNMYLASCPTVKYALGRPKKSKLYFKDLEVQSPYNTYKKLGLPPGPICNPGKEAIHAALHPAKTNYLYFASKGDGTNIFSKSNQDHIDTLYKLGYLRNDIFISPNSKSKVATKATELKDFYGPFLLQE